MATSRSCGPTDVAFGPDGALYMTDSGIRFADFMQGTEVRPDYLEVPMYGRVYKIDTATRAIETLDFRAALSQRHRLRAGPRTCTSAKP